MDFKCVQLRSIWIIDSDAFLDGRLCYGENYWNRNTGI